MEFFLISIRSSFSGPVPAVELRDAVCCIYWSPAKLQMFLFLWELLEAGEKLLFQMLLKSSKCWKLAENHYLILH